jgi:F-box domain
MPPIPVDVLREILEHVGKADLVTLCRVSKIFCSCSQDVLYRHILTDSILIVRTLAQSTDLARRVRSFKCPRLTSTPELVAALKNMSLLRTLDLRVLVYGDSSILDGCTFKLDSFISCFTCEESLRKILDSQPSLTDVQFVSKFDSSVPFEDTSQ